MIFGTCTGVMYKYATQCDGKGLGKGFAHPRKVCGYVIGKSQVGKDNHK
jgi:hypothetical protein